MESITNSYSELFWDELPKQNKKQEIGSSNNEAWWYINQKNEISCFESNTKEKKASTFYNPSLPLFQDGLWRNNLQVNNDQAKTLALAAAPTTASSKSGQFDSIDFQMKGGSSQAITGILNVDSSSPWNYYNYNTGKNGRPCRMDTAKNFWVNSEAAYAEMEQLRVRSLVNISNYSDDDKDNAPETSFWKIFARSEPASPKDLSEYPMSSILFFKNKEKEEEEEEEEEGDICIWI
jgi:hypothetical protein